MSKSHCTQDCYLRVSHLILDCQLPFVSKLGAEGGGLFRSSLLAGAPRRSAEAVFLSSYPIDTLVVNRSAMGTHRK